VIAYLHLARLMDRPDVVGQAFNFSNELQVSVLKLVNLILQVMNCQDLKPEIRNEASNEIEHQYLSARKAHEILAWQPRYDLTKGLEETVRWYKNYLPY
jgi:CDP-glucose 4,6-dehydratase